MFCLVAPYNGYYVYLLLSVNYTLDHSVENALNTLIDPLCAGGVERSAISVSPS